MKLSSSLLLGLCLTVSRLLHAGTPNFPSGNIDFDDRAATRGSGKILKITASEENPADEKWNGFTIVIPGDLKFSPELVIQGRAKIETEQAPTHLSSILTTTEGKTGFLFLTVKPEINKNLSFEAAMAKVRLLPDSRIQEPFNQDDVIKKFSVYASFVEPTASNFILQELSVSE